MEGEIILVAIENLNKDGFQVLPAFVYIGSVLTGRDQQSNVKNTHLPPGSLQVDLEKCSDIRGDFMKWGSLGSCRRSSFASGYEPLKEEPLGSIIDIRKAVLQSP
ncbi:uncharacterized protein LOC108223385 [Daucus carota subsp. sativus]|uniref:uncharacterized protein LOC108223385 n=1 Tax=Daucus carota subsp. sativus TaxID=79200 RepID=UPI003082819F